MRPTIHDYATRMQEEELARFRKHEQERIASGCVRLPADVLEVFETQAGATIWYSESAQQCWVVTEGLARGTCKTRAVEPAELAEANAYFASIDDDPLPE